MRRKHLMVGETTGTGMCRRPQTVIVRILGRKARCVEQRRAGDQAAFHRVCVGGFHPDRGASCWVVGTEAGECGQRNLGWAGDGGDSDLVVL